jgi:two-component system, chemotaxis family, chemotaxis protein CheY
VSAAHLTTLTCEKRAYQRGAKTLYLFLYLNVHCEAPMPHSPSPASVLVVEDNDDIRQAIGELLEDEGYETALAEDGRHALELLSRVPRPCLLLIDLVMPRMDGWQLVDMLSHDDRLATIPVVLMSAASKTALPHHRTLKKPIDLDLLLQIVREHCGDGGRGGRESDRGRALPGE